MFSLFSLRFYIQKCVIFTFYNLIRASREFEGKVFQKYMSLDALPSVLSFSSPAVFTATLYFFFFFFSPLFHFYNLDRAQGDVAVNRRKKFLCPGIKSKETRAKGIIGELTVREGKRKKIFRRINVHRF